MACPAAHVLTPFVTAFAMPAFTVATLAPSFCEPDRVAVSNKGDTPPAVSGLPMIREFDGAATANMNSANQLPPGGANHGDILAGGIRQLSMLRVTAADVVEM